jgi:predicted dehydrogenase
MHREVLTAAAHAKKHIFTEKVLAVTTEEAKEIADAVKDAGIVFTIAHHLCRNPLMNYAKELVDSGVFGKISMIRARRSHSGVSDNWLVDYWFDTEKTGGGAMMDLGAHPMYLLSWLSGKPKRISGVFNNFYGTSSDENAVALIEFENGTIGVSETSFVAYNTHDVLEIYGTDATLLICGDKIKLTSRRDSEQNPGYTTPSVNITELPSVFDIFVDACLGLAQVPAGINIEAGVAVSQLMELAYKSNELNITLVL